MAKTIPNRGVATQWDAIKDFFNVAQVKKIFSLGHEIAQAAHPFIKEQTPLTAAVAVIGVCKVIVDDMQVWPDDFFDDKWVTPFPTCFNRLVLGALSGYPFKVIKTSEESLVIYMVYVDDVKFGYILNTKTDYVVAVYVELEHEQRARTIIMESLWLKMKDSNVVLRKTKSSRVREEDSITIEVDDSFHPMPSTRSTQYASYLKKCISAGVSRSVLLYGPPGTGKSTMARTIVDVLEMRSFRIRVEDVGSFDASMIGQAIEVFRPDAIILDDFDRCDSQESLLETLEFFQRHVKLVIATVNDRHRLDDAILRPGRFDEIMEVKSMEEDVVRSILGPDNESLIDVVKDWPVAFVQELVKRRKFMSPEEATASTQELASRVSRMFSNYDEAESTTHLQRVIRSGKKKRKKA